MLNLGSGLCAFIAPGIVSLYIGPLGAGGVIWIFAVLYFFSAFLTQFLKLPVRCCPCGEKGGQQGGENKFQENG